MGQRICKRMVRLVCAEGLNPMQLAKGNGGVMPCMKAGACDRYVVPEVPKPRAVAPEVLEKYRAREKMLVGAREE